MNAWMAVVRHFPNYEFEVKYFTGLRIDQQRNNMAFYAIEKIFDYIIMVDDDMSFSANSFIQLLEDSMNNDYLVVSALYHLKSYPYHAFLMIEKEWAVIYPNSQLIETQMLGTGLILIDTQVFPRIHRPYFMLAVDCDGNCIGTEDCYFAENCHLNQIAMYVDTSIVAQHLQTVEIPKLFEDPYISYRGKTPFGSIPGNLGNIHEQPRQNFDTTQGPLKPEPKPGFFWHDGIYECAHIEQIKLPHNEGQKPLYKCKRCGMISEGMIE
jgi:hypothetical protein